MFSANEYVQELETQPIDSGANYRTIAYFYYCDEMIKHSFNFYDKIMQLYHSLKHLNKIR